MKARHAATKKMAGTRVFSTVVSLVLSFVLVVSLLMVYAVSQNVYADESASPAEQPVSTTDDQPVIADTQDTQTTPLNPDAQTDGAGSAAVAETQTTNDQIVITPSTLEPEELASPTDEAGQYVFVPLDSAVVATVSMTAEKEGVAPAALVSGYIDDVFSIKATITADGDLYGFTVGFTYLPEVMEFQADTWEMDNPGIPVPDAQGGVVRVSKDSDGATTVISADEPLTIILKFKGIAKRLNPNYTWDPPAPAISFGVAASETRFSLFKDPSLRLADLKNSETGAFLTAAQVPTDIAAKTLVVATVTRATAVIDAWFTTSMTISQELEPQTQPTNSIQTLKVGETAYVTLNLISKKDAYGFTGCITGLSPKFVLDTTKWAIDNPGLSLPEIENNGTFWNLRISKEPSGSTPFITANETHKIIVRLRLAQMNDGMLTVNIGGDASSQRVVLFKDDGMSTALLKDTQTGAFLAPIDIPTTIAKRIISSGNPNNTFFRIMETTTGFTMTVDDTQAKSILPGNTGTIVYSLNSEADAYGFSVQFRYIDDYMTLDSTVWESDNPGLNYRLESMPSGTVTTKILTVFHESDGINKLIPAGGDLPITLTFKPTAYISNVNFFKPTTYTSNYYPFVLVDPNSRLSGETGILAGDDTTVWSTNIAAAESAGSIVLSNSYLTPGLTTRPLSTVVFATTDTLKVGGPGDPVTVVATVSAPSDGKPVYGLESAIYYAGAYLELDRAASLAANPGLALQFGDLINPASTSDSYSQTIQQIFVESDGTSMVIQSGGTLQFKLVFNPTKKCPASNRFITAGATSSLNSDRFILLTDPLLRIKEEGDGLTALNFSQVKITPVEQEHKIVIAEPTALTLTPVAMVDGLVLNTAGYYQINNAADLQKFAEAVNNKGYTTINGIINANFSITDADGFVGIGTPEYPFAGELNGNARTITVECTYTNINNPVIGGIIKYLGSGGFVYRLTLAGELSVSGTGTGSVGSLVGKSSGGSIYSVTSTVAVSLTGSAGNVGGIVGTATPTDLLAIPQINGINNAILATFNSCVFGTATLAGSVTGGTNSGGIVGEFVGNPEKTDDANRIYRSNSRASVSGVNAGGIVGLANDCVLEQCGNGVWANPGTGFAWCNGGQINGTSTAGGVAALANAAYLNNCFNAGVVSAAVFAGGVVGQAGSNTTVSECWSNAAGAISGIANDAAVGGIVGIVASTGVVIVQSYCLSPVGASGTGVLIGGITGKAVVAPTRYYRNYYLESVAGSDGFDTGQLLPAGSLPALKTTLDHLTYTGAQSGIPGKYSYVSDDPVQADDGYYLIASLDDFLWFVAKVNSNVAPDTFNTANYRLAADLDISGETFVPVGVWSGDRVFKGIFDGSGHAITTGAPIFGRCENATIENLVLRGTVVGSAALVTDLQRGSLVNNVHNEATVQGNAGIAARVNGATITNCSNSGAITNSGGGSVGGIASEIYGLTLIENCVNNGNLIGDGAMGGIVADSSNLESIELGGLGVLRIVNCTNNGDVTSTVAATDTYTYRSSVGGILGIAADGRVSVEGCINNGTITSSGNNLGGIVGSVTRSQGAAGPGAISITDCANNGDIISTYDNLSDHNLNNRINVGGILGDALSGSYETEDSLNGRINIDGNTNTGSITVGSGKNVGAIVGNNTNGNGKEIGVIKDNKTNVIYDNDRNKTGVSFIGPRTDPDPDTSKDPNPSQNPDLNSGLNNQNDDTSNTPSDPSTASPPAVDETVGAVVEATVPTIEPTAVPQPTIPTSEPEAAGEVRQPSFFEVVTRTVVDNPAILITILVAAAILAVLGGIWRYRKTNSMR